LDQAYNLFIFERNKNIAEVFREFFIKNYSFDITIFSDQKDDELKTIGSYPNIILFNLSTSNDFNFLSSSVVQYFSEATLILITDPVLEQQMIAVPVFRSVRLLHKPVHINLISDCIDQVVDDLVISNDNELRLGAGFINMRDRTITSHVGSKIYLTDKEFLMIKLLCEARPRVIKKPELLKKIWGYSDNIKTRTLETHIYRLRRKISQVLVDDQLIIHENGGYKLI